MILETFQRLNSIANTMFFGRHGILIFSCLLFVLFEIIFSIKSCHFPNHGILIEKTKPDCFLIFPWQNKIIVKLVYKVQIFSWRPWHINQILRCLITTHVSNKRWFIITEFYTKRKKFLKTHRTFQTKSSKICKASDFFQGFFTGNDLNSRITYSTGCKRRIRKICEFKI